MTIVCLVSDDHCEIIQSGLASQGQGLDRSTRPNSSSWQVQSVRRWKMPCKETWRVKSTANNAFYFWFVFCQLDIYKECICKSVSHYPGTVQNVDDYCCFCDLVLVFIIVFLALRFPGQSMESRCIMIIHDFNQQSFRRIFYTIVWLKWISVIMKRLIQSNCVYKLFEGSER